MKIIFLDVDGPMIPTRAYFLDGNRSFTPNCGRTFDSCAVSMVNILLKRAGAKLVISSTWAAMGRERFSAVMVENGLNPADLHDDWATPRKMSSHRATEIKWWLEKHPETTHYAAFDDDDVSNLAGGVRCTFDDGLQMKHFRKATHQLGLPDQGLFILEEPDDADAP